MRPHGTNQPLSSVAVASSDPVAYVAAWLLGFVVVCTVLLLLYTQVTGESPREPWSEIVLGVSLIAAVFYGLIRHRGSRIARLLETGERSLADVRAFRAMDQWAHVTLAYDRHGQTIERRLLLASTLRTRALSEREVVTIATDPDRPKRLVVTDLYES